MITLPPIKKKEIPRQYFAALDHLNGGFLLRKWPFNTWEIPLVPDLFTKYVNYCYTFVCRKMLHTKGWVTWKNYYSQHFVYCLLERLSIPVLRGYTPLNQTLMYRQRLLLTMKRHLEAYRMIQLSEQLMTMWSKNRI